MELFVVRCYMEGCEECSNEYHVVGVFSSFLRAQAAEKRHRQYKHLHSASTNIDKVVLDEYTKLPYEGE